MLELSSSEMEAVIRSRYFKTTAYGSTDTQMHQLLAAFFQMQADPAKNGSWAGSNPRAFLALPYHLVSNLFGSLALRNLYRVRVVHNMFFIYVFLGFCWFILRT